MSLHYALSYSVLSANGRRERSGYRIRGLTDAEKEVKVSQMVARQREWEDGLVGVYKKFLEMCETEVTGTSPSLCRHLTSSTDPILRW